MDVSVVITSFNQKKYLTRAIKSVLNQTIEPDQIIISDDNSTDGSKKIIKRYQNNKQNKIHSILRNKNVGIAKNRSDAYRAATGEFITYLDGDDFFRPRKIEVDLETFRENPAADIACANIAYVDHNGHQVGTWCGTKDDVPTGDVAIEVMARNFPRGSLFRNEMVKREKLAQSGFYDTRLSLYEDWDLKIRLSQNSRLAYSHEVTSAYRKHPRGVSSSHAGRHLLACKKIYRKHRDKIESAAPDDRQHINHNLRPWIGQFGWDAFRNAVTRGDRTSAWAYLVDALKFAPQSADKRALAKFLLPKDFVDVIRPIF